MFDLQQRQLWQDLLRPPAGYEFDRAIGTTYSLNLMAVLTMPVAFTIFDRSIAGKKSEQADPLALLHSIYNCAQRMHIFCPN